MYIYSQTCSYFYHVFYLHHDYLTIQSTKIENIWCVRMCSITRDRGEWNVVFSGSKNGPRPGLGMVTDWQSKYCVSTVLNEMLSKIEKKQITFKGFVLKIYSTGIFVGSHFSFIYNLTKEYRHLSVYNKNVNVNQDPSVPPCNFYCFLPQAGWVCPIVYYLDVLTVAWANYFLLLGITQVMTRRYLIYCF